MRRKDGLHCEISLQNNRLSRQGGCTRKWCGRFVGNIADIHSFSAERPLSPEPTLVRCCRAAALRQKMCVALSAFWMEWCNFADVNVSDSLLGMTLHVFNPEHDMALAANTEGFTPPDAAKRLRHDLGFLPALWAGEGDAVLVDDVDAAERGLMELRHSADANVAMPLFVTERELRGLPITGIEPWGWDRALRHRLASGGVNPSLLPSADALAAIREMSHRRFASALLGALRLPGTVGEAYCLSDCAEVLDFIEANPKAVVKAPWSCSGRGVRFIGAADSAQSNVSGWIKNMLKQQGSVTVEPYYSKTMDFGMEFLCDGAGNVSYCGLSVFRSAGQVYTGSLLATESEKRGIIGRHVATTLADEVKAKAMAALGSACKGVYEGPVGIDMMIVCGDGGEARLHPCVEVNLRRTMGHVALALSPASGQTKREMRIEVDNNKYKLKIQPL